MIEGLTDIDGTVHALQGAGYKYNEEKLSVAEGINTLASGIGSHAEGQQSAALGDLSHAEGGATTAGGDYSHTEGNSTVTNNLYEHAEGHFNYSHINSGTYGDAGNTIHSVGIGNTLMNRKNALEIMQNGDIYVKNVGEYDGTNPEEANSLQSVVNAKQDKLIGINNIWTGTQVEYDAIVTKDNNILYIIK